MQDSFLLAYQNSSHIGTLNMQDSDSPEIASNSHGYSTFRFRTVSVPNDTLPTRIARKKANKPVSLSCYPTVISITTISIAVGFHQEKPVSPERDAHKRKG